MDNRTLPSMSALPADVVLMICEELGNRHEFGSLFSYALTGKRFAGPALFWLYRDHDNSPYFRGDENEDDLRGNATWEENSEKYKVYASKWALLWKSIIRSSIGNTAYPYCLYIRTLDLRNLNTLLEDYHFREASQSSFFAEDMAIFLHEVGGIKRTRAGKQVPVRLAVEPICQAVGESITSYASDEAKRNQVTAALEDISGQIESASLATWTSRLPRLQSMTIFDGAALNEEVGKSINDHCKDFNDVTFLRGQGDNVDSDMAAFLGALPINSLESFTALGAEDLRSQSLIALNIHSKSLKNLKLDGLRTEAIKKLSLLRGCEALEVLNLHDSFGTIDLEATENDIFLEVVAWLSRCERLQDLTLVKFASAAAILKPVCLCKTIKLQKLEVRGYNLLGNADFHRALSHQTALESLILRGDPEACTHDDLATLVSSLSQLVKLKSLDISETSELFNSTTIAQLATNLPALEEFTFAGYDATDDIWRSMSSLHYLRSLTSMALSSYSCNGLLNYIDTLRPTNRGLNLAIMSQNLTYDFTDAEKAAIQRNIAAKVGGRFEYVLFREDADIDFASDSD